MSKSVESVYCLHKEPYNDRCVACLRRRLEEAKGLLSEAWTDLSAELAATFQNPDGDSLSVRIFAFLQGWGKITDK